MHSDCCSEFNSLTIYCYSYRHDSFHVPIVYFCRILETCKIDMLKYKKCFLFSKIYVDGSEVGTIASPAGHYFNGDIIYIGKHQFGMDYYKGDMSCLQFYNYTLEPESVRHQMYRCQRERRIGNSENYMLSI